MNPLLDRRQFQQTAVAAGVTAACALPGRAIQGSNDRIRLGVIGLGNRGDQLLDAFLPHADAQIIALCDLYEPYREAAQKKVGGKATLYTDYRKLLENKDIDAVVIATPDHWHALQCVAACRAGKDVYVEKPVSLTIAEGRKMVQVAKETGRITQVGLHRRSSKSLHEAIELLHAGAIGRVTVVRCFHIRNESPMGIGNPADCVAPAGFDWDTWLGPAPKVAYNPNRCFYKFRWFNDYSGGQLTNFGTHYLDVIQWALKKDAPKGVFAVGGKYVVADNREIPDTMEVVWDYDGVLVTFSQFNANNVGSNVRSAEMEFRGTLGTMLFDNGNWEIIPEKVRTGEMPALSPIHRQEDAERNKMVKYAMAPRVVKGKADTTDHARNFLDAVKSRTPGHCPIETGHRSTSATLLGKIALARGRYLQWDGAAERIVNDDEANRLLTYTYREPWSLA
ncbi:MAG TPA: Gfo/Idh/MocA family oxidoreductase [Gemmataceae bacterium]|jgi:predicted dehydrogenase|nr:Gfo/Idh/MocA family oxidoreductase [Gemmataceae bacterium]